ncbi:MAG: class I SAM-dependent methyltransferase, partial [Christensenellaceae bacterium]|nr:class I SAM-dependent methyltransferase [Christensenellaceae bacterium]
IAIEGQPKEQIYYHRSIQDIFNLCFRAGFVIDGFYEECFKTNKEIPKICAMSQTGIKLVLFWY